VRRLIRGIHCTLKVPASRRIVADVLRQIERVSPKDFKRLREVVALIRPLPRAKLADGTIGEWLGKTFEEANAGADFFSFPAEIRLRWDEWATGTVELVEATQTDAHGLAALAAHEFGHACTRQDDLRRRNAPSDEWASEAAADWYAYRWGFGELIRRARKLTNWGHHGAEPRRTIWLGDEAYRVSRNFVYHYEPNPQQPNTRAGRPADCEGGRDK
jgi:hypothetical protein